MKARVGIVDDHPAVLLGVTAILNAQPDMHVVATSTTVAGLLQAETRFHLVLLDLVLADGSTPVLAYTSGDQPRLVREAARAGVIGMIRKSELPHAVAKTVRMALHDEPIATADWAAALNGDRSFVDAALTPRESEVLALYASGETADRVADALFVSRDTVLDHIRRIRSRYAAVDRAAPTKVDLFRRAVEDGLVPPETGV